MSNREKIASVKNLYGYDDAELAEAIGSTLPQVMDWQGKAYRERIQDLLYDVPSKNETAKFKPKRGIKRFITGEDVKRICEAKHYTQRELGGMLGVSSSLINRWEHGADKVAMHHQKTLQGIFDDVFEEEKGTLERVESCPLMGEKNCFPTQIITTEYLEAIRNKYGYSMSEIDRRIGASTGTYYHWIEREHVPTKRIKAVCDVLGVHIKVPPVPSCKRLRAELGLTRVEMGELLGVHDTTIGNCELYGDKIPSKAQTLFLEYWNEVFPN